MSDPLPGIRYTVAIASGKGGVGKSTVAANLAVALARDGSRVGLLDADIYGATIPTMLGRREGVTPEGSRLLPAELHGVRMMSMGLLLQPGRDTLVWRGPMVAKAVSQMLTDVDWGELDYLIFDLPPGTGDAPLTLAQQVPLAGGVVVCTPQEVAIRTALKSVTMFRTLRVPVLGVVENMSFFLCPNCGHRSEIFAHGGAERACQEEGLPFLGAIPLDETVRASGDAGEPVALHGETAQGEIFRSIARRLVTELRHSAEAAPPTITVN